jgi:hypothetical protein
MMSDQPVAGSSICSCARLTPRAKPNVRQSTADELLNNLGNHKMLK